MPRAADEFTVVVRCPHRRKFRVQLSVLQDRFTSVVDGCDKAQAERGTVTPPGRIRLWWAFRKARRQLDRPPDWLPKH